MSSKIDISIILTSYNFERYIEHAIISLLNQKYDGNIELIIVDDASKDNSAQIIAEYAKRDSRIKFIPHAQNQGAANSINEAMSKAKGGFICRFDGDDYWDPNFLSETSQFLIKNPEVGLVYADCSYVDSNNQITNTNVKTRRAQKEEIAWEFNDLLNDYYITAPTIMFRSEALLEHYPFPANFNYLDWFISLSIAQKYKLGYLPKTLAFYRIHAQGMHVQMIANKNGENTTFEILKHFSNLKAINDAKLKELKSIYWRKFGLNYFGQDMFTDARRCFSNYLKIKTGNLLDTEIWKFYLASLLGKNYQRLKSKFR